VNLACQARAGGLSQIAAAQASGITQAKISRLENGLFTPRPQDVRRLARAYQAAPEVRRELEQAAQDLADDRVYSRVILQRGAWRLQAKVARIEETCERLRAFHPVIIPGLLQTPAYAAKVIGSKAAGQDLDRAVTARITRQRILGSDRDITLITTQGALRWHTGSPGLMIEQLEQILAASAIPNVNIGVVDWTSPIDVFPQEGFDIYDTRAVIVGTETATATITDDHDVAAYDNLFRTLEAAARFGDDARAIITNLISEYRSLPPVSGN
jgi:transcriptional regulator with XRE-family HTH domain